MSTESDVKGFPTTSNAIDLLPEFFNAALHIWLKNHKYQARTFLLRGTRILEEHCHSGGRSERYRYYRCLPDQVRRLAATGIIDLAIFEKAGATSTERTLLGAAITNDQADRYLVSPLPKGPSEFRTVTITDIPSSQLKFPFLDGVRMHWGKAQLGSQDSAGDAEGVSDPDRGC